MSRHPDFARVAFCPADGDRVFVWDPVPDTLRPLADPQPNPQPDFYLDFIHQAIQRECLTHVPAREVVSRALRSLGIAHEIIDCDPGPPGPESAPLPPGAVA